MIPRLAGGLLTFALLGSVACSDSGSADGLNEPTRSGASADVAWSNWPAVLSTEGAVGATRTGESTSHGDSTPPVAVEVRPDVYEITYTDITDLERTVQFEVRTPRGGAAGRPVVVWSHGGSTGKQSTRNAGVRWGKAMNDDGNVFVAVAHPGRSAESRAALCAAIEVTNCADFKYLLWDRLTDVILVFDWLEAAASSGELMVDMDHLVYGGHSAGAVAVMVMAGMTSPYETGVPMPSDPRPAAFLAASPPGAEENGLTAASFAGLDRPVLLLTGPADTTNGTAGVDRLAAFDLIDTDQVMLVSTSSEQVGHTTFDLNIDPCRRAGGDAEACRTTVRALGKTAQFFLRSALSPTGLDPSALIDHVTARLPEEMQLQSAG